MRFTRLSLALACAFLLSTSAVSVAQAQDRSPVTASSNTSATPATLDLGFLGNPGRDLVPAIRTRGFGTTNAGIAFSPGQSFRFRTEFPAKAIVAFTATPLDSVMVEEKPVVDGFPDAPSTWEYTVTVAQGAPRGTPVKLEMSDASDPSSTAFNFTTALQVPTTADRINLGELDSPGTQLQDAAANAGQGTPDGQIALAPGQTLTFRTNFPPGYDGSKVTFTGGPPSLVTTKAREITYQATGLPTAWEYSVTLSPNATGDVPVALQMSDPLHGDNRAWNFNIEVRPTVSQTAPATYSERPADEGSTSPASTPASAPSRSVLGWLKDKFVSTFVTPLENIVRAAVDAAGRSATDSYGRARGSADRNTLVGADGQPLPDDVANAIRQRGDHAAPTPGLSGVLNERIHDESHPERSSGE
jgi:hypothetical protein